MVSMHAAASVSVVLAFGMVSMLTSSASGMFSVVSRMLISVSGVFAAVAGKISAILMSVVAAIAVEHIACFPITQ